MRGHTAGNVDADGGDLGFLIRIRTRIGPDAGEATDALGWNRELSTGADEYFFQPAYVFDRA